MIKSKKYLQQYQVCHTGVCVMKSDRKEHITRMYIFHHKSRDEIIEYDSIEKYLYRNKQFQPVEDDEKMPFDDYNCTYLDHNM